jgi:predicted DNA-binding protein (MmcQ/YjbR family)
MTYQEVLENMRAICLALPDAKEAITWGHPTFRVGEKIFASCGGDDSQMSLGCKLKMEHAVEIIEDPRFTKAAYVGNKGWVSMDASKVTDWNEVKALILESYRLIAPKKSIAKLKP